MEFVFRFIKKRLVVAGDVTRQAASGILGRFSVEAKDKFFGGSRFLVVSACILDRLNVSLAGSMTTFASSAIFRILRCRFGMCVLPKHVCMDWMASCAGICASIIVTLSFRRRFPYHR